MSMLFFVRQTKVAIRHHCGPDLEEARRLSLSQDQSNEGTHQLEAVIKWNDVHTCGMVLQD